VHQIADSTADRSRWRPVSRARLADRDYRHLERDGCAVGHGSQRPGGAPLLTRGEAEAQYGSCLRRTEAAEAAALTELVKTPGMHVHYVPEGGKTPRLWGVVTELLKAEGKDISHPRKWRGSLKRLVSLGTTSVVPGAAQQAGLVQWAQAGLDKRCRHARQAARR
jgi:hypothetical protein